MGVSDKSKQIKRPGRSKTFRVAKEIPKVTSDGNSSLNKLLTPEELAEVRERIKQKQKLARETPKLFFDLGSLRKTCQFYGNDPKLLSDSDGFGLKGTRETVLFPFDVQELILRATLGGRYLPRWCRLLRFRFIEKVVVVVVENVGNPEWEAYTECFPNLQSMSPELPAKLLPPVMLGTSFVEEFLKIPFSLSLQKVIDYKYPKIGSEENSYSYFSSISESELPEMSEVDIEVVRLLADKTRDPVARESMKADGVVTWVDNRLHSDVLPRTQLLLGASDMGRENFPLPYNLPEDVANEYVASSPEGYVSVSDASPIFAVDCEMCLTERRMLELTHIAVVDEKLNSVFQSLVKPRARIVNYLTQYSGITEEMLANVTTTLSDVQLRLQDILPKNAILVGHGLNSDLTAMRMLHPYVIDTSVIYNLKGLEGKKSKLRDLAHLFLGKNIQEFNTATEGHDALEDAVVTMELTLLKLRNCAEFGNLTYPTSLWPLSPTAFVSWYSSIKIKQESVRDKMKTDAGLENHAAQKVEVGIAESEGPLVSNTQSAEDKSSSPSSSGTYISLRDSFLRRSRAALNNGFHDLFKSIVIKRNRNGTIVDHEDDLTKFKSSPVTVVGQLTDKLIAKEMVAAIADDFLVFGRLHRFSSFIDANEERKRRSLTKIDRRLGKIYGKLPKKALMIVVLGGRKIENGNHSVVEKYHNGLVFAGIKH